MKNLGFGFMRLPLKDPEDFKSVDLETLKQMVDTFMERGFCYFDTAYMYHEGASEVAVREAVVRRYPRDRFVLADKMPVMMLKEKEDLQRIFDEQMERCGVDYFDIYHLHNLNMGNYKATCELGAFEFIRQKQKEGKIRHIAFSFHDRADLLDEILTAHPEIEYVQLQINYMDWDNDSIQSGKCYETARRHGKPIIVMEPVKGGTLAKVPEKVEKLFREHSPEMSPASWAVRYAASLEGVMMVLSGMSDTAQLLDNTSYMQNFQPLTPQERTVVKEAARIIGESIAIPCTACQYCVDTCPKDIPIPKYFALYNNEKQSEPARFSLQKLYYGNYAKTHGKASDCIACRECERHCPQQLEVVRYLKEVAQHFETE